MQEEIYPEERETVILQRRCIRAKQYIPKDTKITENILEILRPAPIDSIYPKYITKLINKKARLDIKKGQEIKWNMILE